MFVFVALAALFVGSNARPNFNVGPQNVVTVPPNCPPGQQFINGQCRDVWGRNTHAPNNVITVPPNCPPGQQFINGQCRDVWGRNTHVPNNVITVPPNCPPGQEFINGQCRDIWKQQQYFPSEVGVVEQNPMEPLNVVTVPPNCPEGQEYIDGQCRDVWRKQIEASDSEIMVAIKRMLKTFGPARYTGKADEADPAKEIRNIISVPNQCPIGHRPDALGICRPVFD